MGNCDRCLKRAATRIVLCWYRCFHFQCSRCERQTMYESGAWMG